MNRIASTIVIGLIVAAAADQARAALIWTERFDIHPFTTNRWIRRDQGCVGNGQWDGFFVRNDVADQCSGVTPAQFVRWRGDLRKCMIYNNGAFGDIPTAQYVNLNLSFRYNLNQGDLLGCDVLVGANWINIVQVSAFGGWQTFSGPVPDDVISIRFKLIPGSVGGITPNVRLDCIEITGDLDTDYDNVPDSQDGCPNDGSKTSPGTCGCGVPDSNFRTWYRDQDNDGAGDPNQTQNSCTQPSGYVANADDGCPNDGNKTSPGTCGCGVPDSNFRTWYRDQDDDGAGDPMQSQNSCTQPSGYVANANDGCPNDGNKTSPGTCGCGVPDSNFRTWFLDQDGDGAGDPNQTQDSCTQPSGYVANANDGCPNDGNKTSPGTCGCGVSDSNFRTWFLDQDGDGAGDPNQTQDSCTQPSGYVANANDGCPNDGNKVSPGTCGCGVPDSDFRTWFLDQDGDGAGDPNQTQDSCTQPSGYVGNSDDGCPNDANQTSPGACGCTTPPGVMSARLYVNANASGLETGDNWANAFRNLQTALSVARANPGVVDEIWVAQGVYDTSCAEFELADGVNIYGGFDGTESVLSERLPAVNRTVLSAMLNHPDPLNAYVIGTMQFSGSATLDGMIITGRVRSSLIMESGSLTIQNCSFEFSGSLRQTGGNLILRNCLFLWNRSGFFGAVSCLGGTASITNCTFHANYGWGGGSLVAGGIEISDSSVSVKNSIFWGNFAEFGGPEQIAVFGGPQGAGELTISHSVVQNGQLDIRGDGIVNWGPGNLAVNPLLTRQGRLRAGSPCIDAGGDTGIPASDIDGEPRPSGGGVDIGYDEFVDSDGDDLPDWFEAAYPTAAAPESDPDMDGATSLEEYETYGTTPDGALVYVDVNNNSGPWDGTFSSPFQTLQDGIDAAADGDTILVLPGIYSNPRDRDLNFVGKAVLLISAGGPTATILDGLGSESNIFAGGLLSTIAGFEFRRFSVAAASDLPLLANCDFNDNQGVISTSRNIVRLSNIEFLDNPFNLALEGCSVELQNTTQLLNGVARLENVFISGDGQLEIMAGARVVIGIEPGFIEIFPLPQGPVSMATTLTGNGVIEITPVGTLEILEGSLVDLSGTTPTGECSITDSEAWGTIIVNGTLLGLGGTIQQSQIDVLLGSIENESIIENNDIRLIETAAGYGGEFFVSGETTVRCNVIRSEGDRYLDLDPDPTADPRPFIGDNQLFVTIRQGVTGDQGELLELRTEDSDPAVGGGLSGAHQLAGSAGYDDTWVLEELEVLADAKVNLTNRPGFVFQDRQIAAFEALYVKQLKLHPGAVLNTGLQRMYYQSVVDENDSPLGSPDVDGFFPNGARLVDTPLLGFSLKVISMEDDTEFAVRVRPRLRDPNDVQPPSCEFGGPCLQGSIERIEDPSDANNGVMEMKTRADGQGSASSVSAHGAFARAGEDEILVAFEYTFCGNPTDELVVYLSDAPEVGQNLVEIARITPPTSGPGSIGSDQFATFSGLFPRGSLNFRRGTYVELELVGQDACVLIDEWDPLACGSPECGDYDLSYFISNVDVLYGLTALGSEVGQNNSCLDKVNRDNYVDVNDVLLSDALYGYGVSQGLCVGGAGSSSFAAVTNGVSAPADQLIIAGKPNAGGDLEDQLYPVDAATSDSGRNIAPPVAAGDPFYGQRGHGRLVKDGNGTLYQLHSVAGLVRLSDGQVMVAPGEQSFNGNTVRLGMPPTGSGLPLFDAAFDPNDPTTVYVVPARIIPASGESDAYYVAAQLSLTENAGVVTWTIQETYGFDPQTDPNNNTQPPQFSQTNVQYLREIETDSDGNVYVTCARADNQNDWLLIYKAAMGTASEQRVRLSDLPVPLRGPAALHVSDDGSKLYLGTSLDEGDPATTTVQEFTLGGMSGAITVTPSRVIEIGNMRFATAIAEDTNGTAYVVGYTAPVQDPFSIFFFDSDGLFTTPTLATLPPVGTTTTATTITGADAALPLSAVFSSSNTPSCMPGDMDSSGAVDTGDIASFVDVLLNGTVDPDQACRADVNQDGTSDGRDVGTLVDLITAP